MDKELKLLYYFNFGPYLESKSMETREGELNLFHSVAIDKIKNLDLMGLHKYNPVVTLRIDIAASRRHQIDKNNKFYAINGFYDIIILNLVKAYDEWIRFLWVEITGEDYESKMKFIKQIRSLT